MSIAVWLQRFWEDDKVSALLVLIAVDFVLGVLAAVKVGNFRLSYVSDFLRNDFLFKVVPYFAVYAGSLVLGGNDVILGFIDLGDVALSVYAIVMVAMAASIANSVNELMNQPRGEQTLKHAFLADENAAPPKD